MHNKIKLVVLSALIFTLAGCAQFTTGTRAVAPSNDKSQPRLRVPAGMDISFNTLYPIPQRNYPSNPRSVDLTPPSLDVNPNAHSGWFSWY